ncbi:MAG: metal ABC transporter substrate-binding protein [Acidithiobacillales bacterium]
MSRLSTLALALAASACAGPPPAPGRLAAAATISPLADIVARVAGPGWTVRTVIPPGVSPHVFEPTPKDVRLVAPARLVVTVGAGFDGWAAKLVAACSSQAALFDAGRAAGIEAAGHGASDDEHSHGDLGHDPHWWLSPPLVGKILPALAGELSALDPEGAAGYRSRAADLAGELSRLDAEIARTLAPVAGSSLVTTHNAWSYFAARYRLKVAASVEPVPGREPTPREFRALVLAARREGVRTLFTEPEFPPDAARVVAHEAGLRVETVDPIGGVPGRVSYEELLRYDARTFREGLEAR